MPLAVMPWPLVQVTKTGGENVTAAVGGRPTSSWNGVYGGRYRRSPSCLHNKKNRGTNEPTDVQKKEMKK